MSIYAADENPNDKQQLKRSADSRNLGQQNEKRAMIRSIASSSKMKRVFAHPGSTQADRSLQKLYHPAGRLGGGDRRSDLACDEWPESAMLSTPSHL
jgi:hypothetical protein